MDNQEEIISCSKCGCTPEDVLILTCDHNLCIPCAAANLRREQQKFKHTFQTVVCDICGSSTVLDPSSATELLTQQYPKEQPIHKLPAPAKERHRAEVIKPPSKVYNSIEAYCSSHPDEEVTYFCFDCLAPPVCSECVIHGIHKDHEVMHIKKGYPVVKEKLEEVIQGLMTSVESLQGDRKALLSKKDLLMNQGEAAKVQLKTLIDDLISRIEKKEKELIRSIDLATEDSLKELESYERVMEDRLSTLSNNINYIQDNMAGGLLSTLNFYADNNKLLMQVADQELQKNDRYGTHLIASNVTTPDVVMKELKDAASLAAEAIGRIKFRTKKNSIRDTNEGRSFVKNSMEADDYS